MKPAEQVAERHRQSGGIFTAMRSIMSSGVNGG